MSKYFEDIHSDSGNLMTRVYFTNVGEELLKIDFDDNGKITCIIDYEYLADGTCSSWNVKNGEGVAMFRYIILNEDSEGMTVRETNLKTGEEVVLKGV